MIAPNAHKTLLNVLVTWDRVWENSSSITRSPPILIRWGPLSAGQLDRLMDNSRNGQLTKRENKVFAHTKKEEIVISCRVEKSGPFRTRFSVQRVVFSSRCPFFDPGGIFFSRGTREKIPPGSKKDCGRKKHSRRTEKRVRKGPLFSTRHEITIIL